VIPTGFESEQVAGSDHDAKHGDPNERPAIPDLDAAAGLFGWSIVQWDRRATATREATARVKSPDRK
jgi:hypothetical protein